MACKVVLNLLQKILMSLVLMMKFDELSEIVFETVQLDYLATITKHHYKTFCIVINKHVVLIDS